MEGLTGQPAVTEDGDSPWKPMVAGLALVLIVVGAIVWFSRSEPKAKASPPPYAANIKISDVKMSTAQNFVGASVIYVEGRLTNAGDKTVSHVVTQVTFQDSMGQVTQVETVPLYVIGASGPYPDPVDLRVSPLAPGKSAPFRIAFEHVSAEWNQAYPAMSIVDVTTK